MVNDEQQLVELLVQCGFDFQSNVRELARRFSKVADWGVKDFQIVPLRLTTPLAGLGDIWKIPVAREYNMELPPARYKHEYHPTSDAKTNHHLAEAALMKLLGDGKKGQATNVYSRDWQIDFFTIRVITWPRELNQRLANSFEGKNPYLWISANVSIEPEFPFIYPIEDGAAPMTVILRPGNGYKLVCESEVYARRKRVRASEVAVGLAKGALLIRQEDRTVRVPFEEIEKIEHRKVEPTEGPGGSEIWLQGKFMGRYAVSVKLATGNQPDTLDEQVRAISSAILKPIEVQEDKNDYPH